MIIRLLGVAIIILLSSVATAINVNESGVDRPETKSVGEMENKTILEVTEISGPIGLSAKITNVGDYNATEVRWDFYTYSITSPIHYDGGTIPNILPGESEYVWGFKPVPGLGWIFIDAELECQNADPVKETERAFLFFFFFIFL